MPETVKRSWIDSLLSAMGADTLPRRSRMDDVLGAMESGMKLPERSRMDDLLDAVSPDFEGARAKRAAEIQAQQAGRAGNFEVKSVPMDPRPMLDPETLKRIIGGMQSSFPQPPNPTEYRNTSGFSMDSALEAPSPMQLRTSDPGFSMTPPSPALAPSIEDEAKALRESLGGKWPDVGPPGPPPAPVPLPGSETKYRLRYDAGGQGGLGAQVSNMLPGWNAKALDEAMVQGAGNPLRPEPFQVAADQEKYERKAQFLEGLADLTEGTQNMSRNMRTAGSLMMGLDDQPEYVATGLRGMAAQARDKVSPAQQDYYRSLGVDLPPGMTQGQLKQALPLMVENLQLPAEVMRQQGIQGHRDRMYGVARDNAAMRAMSQGRLSRKEETATINQTLKRYGEAVQAAQSVLDVASTDNPLAMQAAFVQLARAVGDTGALSNQDISRWNAFPGLEGVFQNVQKFITSDFTPELKNAVKQVAKELLTNRQRRVSDYLSTRRNGFAVNNPDSSEEQLNALFNPDAYIPGFSGEAGDGGDVDIISEDGTEDAISSEQLDAFLKANPTWRRK